MRTVRPDNLYRLTLCAPQLVLGRLDSFSEEDKRRFKDPEYYKRFRHEIENDLNVDSFTFSLLPYILTICLCS